MKLKHFIFSLLLILLTSACSLNGEQEASLNETLSEFIEARNNNRVSLRVRLSYPSAVRYYKSKGDDVFKEHYRPENNDEFWQDGTLLDVEQKGDHIHVKYEFKAVFEQEMELVWDKRYLYAISIDDGKHWKFLDAHEYKNPEILPRDKKLIKE